QPAKIGCRTLLTNFETPAVKADFASIDVHSPAEFLGFMLMDQEHVAQYLARNHDDQVNTDDNAYLEYRTPFEFLTRTDDIVPDLIKNAGWDANRIFAPDCGDKLRRDAHANLEKRLAQIIPELAEPIR